MKNAADLPTADGRTRDRVVGLLLRRGPLTAAELAEGLGLSPAGVRRHLDALVSDGAVSERADRPVGRRTRGRPARRYVLTDRGREDFPHTYDDLAVSAVRYLARTGGEEAVERFAAHQVAELERRCRSAMDGAGSDPMARAEALASALSAEGYAATASALAAGGQLCQHHCPVAHVAAEFPQLCEAETEVISRLVGTRVLRLATIARGDDACTTHIPGGTYYDTRAGAKAGASNPNTPKSASPAGSKASKHPVPTGSRRTSV